jgi:N-methylhydantoinase A
VPTRVPSATAARQEPTITDANVVLGRLDPDNFLGGTMKLDADGARRGIETKIAKPLKLDTIAAAQAIVDISINKMSLAVREVSVAKGYDPRDFALVGFGGAAPLHVCAIARELFIPTVIVPLFPRIPRSVCCLPTSVTTSPHCHSDLPVDFANSCGA